MRRENKRYKLRLTGRGSQEHTGYLETMNLWGNLLTVKRRYVRPPLGDGYFYQGKSRQCLSHRALTTRTYRATTLLCLGTVSQPARANSFPSLSHTTLGCEQKCFTYHSFAGKGGVHTPGLECRSSYSSQFLLKLDSSHGLGNTPQALILPAWKGGGGGGAAWLVELFFSCGTFKSTPKVSAKRPSLESWAERHNKVDPRAHRKTRL